MIDITGLGRPYGRAAAGSAEQDAPTSDGQGPGSLPALPVAGFYRALASVFSGTASTNLRWECKNEPGSLGVCSCCQPPPDPPFSVVRDAD